MARSCLPFYEPGGRVTNCQELFSTLGVVYPNHVRAIVSEGKLEGIAGRFNPQTLQALGQSIEAACPDHSAFQNGQANAHRISCRQSLVWTAERSNFVVRYIHVDHEPGVCQLLAISAGPLAAIGEISLGQTGLLSLTDKEMTVALSIAAGKNAHQIANDTQHSVHTIRNQIKSALRSTGNHSQMQLALLMRDWIF